MTDPNDFQSLDQLFKNTFEQLPQEPAANGWDQPSPRVWQNIQSAVQTPPKSGWRPSAWAIASAGVVLISAVVFLLTRPEQPAAPRTGQQAVAPRQEQAATETPVAPTIQDFPGSEPAHTAQSIPPIAPEQQEETPQTPTLPSERPEVAMPLPGTEFIAPNTTLRKRLEKNQAQSDIWLTPLEPLPVKWPEYIEWE